MCKYDRFYIADCKFADTVPMDTINSLNKMYVLLIKTSDSAPISNKTYTELMLMKKY